MAAQVCTEGNGGGDDEDGAPALPLCLLQDLLGVAAFLASYPLHAAYALFFSRYLISLAAFFCPLLVSTSLLLAVLVTAAPYVYPEWTGVYSLGRTCGIAVDALCAEVRPDSAGVELVVQICSFVLGSADGAGVLCVGEIMSELCDITSGSCFLLEEKSLLLGTEECCKLGVELPLQTLIGEKIFSDHGKFGEIQSGIEDKIVVCEDLNEFKGSASSSEHSFSSETFMQKIEEEDRVRDGSDIAKRLECDPGSVEIMKCEQVRSYSLVSGRKRQWEAQVCRNFIQLPEETADNPSEFSLEKRSLMEMKESAQLETKDRDKKCSKTIQAQEIPIVEESVQVQQQQGQEFKDVKQSDTKTSSEKCSEVQAEELSASTVQPRQEWIERSQDLQAEPELQKQERKDVQPGQEWQEQSHKDVQVEQDPQEHEYNYTEPEEEFRDQEDKVAQPDPELHGQEYKHADVESESLCDDERVDSLKSTSIAWCVHSRTTSENLVSEEGSLRKEKEWKRTLACKLYEERMKLKVCREPAVIGCNDDMDMLWEAYEAAGSGDKAKGDNTQEDFVEEGKKEEGGDEDEGSVRQLCCLQALKFSTRKMNFAGSKPSLAKISKVLKRMTALSRIRSGRNPTG